MDWVEVGSIIAGLSLLLGTCAWVFMRLLAVENRLGTFMTRDEHAALCIERNRLSEQRIREMHEDNQRGIDNIQKHLEKQDREARQRAEVLSKIQIDVAVLQENKRANERIRDQRT